MSRHAAAHKAVHRAAKRRPGTLAKVGALLAAPLPDVELLIGAMANPDSGIRFVLGIVKKAGHKISEVQSVMFDKLKWTADAAKAWLKEHGFTTPKADEAATFWRFRQEDPKKYKEYRTVVPGTRRNPTDEGSHYAVLDGVRVGLGTGGTIIFSTDWDYLWKLAAKGDARLIKQSGGPSTYGHTNLLYIGKSARPYPASEENPALDLSWLQVGDTFAPQFGQHLKGKELVWLYRNSDGRELAVRVGDVLEFNSAPVSLLTTTPYRREIAMWAVPVNQKGRMDSRYSLVFEGVPGYSYGEKWRLRHVSKENPAPDVADAISSYDEHLDITTRPEFQAATPDEQAAVMTAVDLAENPVPSVADGPGLHVVHKQGEYYAYANGKYLWRHHDPEQLTMILKREWGWDWDGKVEREAWENQGNAESNPQATYKWEWFPLSDGWQYGIRNVNLDVVRSTPLWVVGAMMPNGNILSANFTQEGRTGAMLDAQEWAEKRQAEFARRRNPERMETGGPMVTRKLLLIDVKFTKSAEKLGRIIGVAREQGWAEVVQAAEAKAKRLKIRPEALERHAAKIVPWCNPEMSGWFALREGTVHDPRWRVVHYTDGQRDPAGGASHIFYDRHEAQAWANNLNSKDQTASSKPQSNPESSAAELYEEFHGKPPGETLEIITEKQEHEWLTQLGTLVELKVATLTQLDATIRFDKDAPELCSSEDGRQLYIEGGDQSIGLKALKMDSDKWVKDSMTLGVLYELTYQTEKGFQAFKLTDYYHKLGEETGVQPFLLYDPRSQLLSISGGQYQTKPEGIVN
jgi:hypothetical protein